MKRLLGAVDTVACTSLPKVHGRLQRGGLQLDPASRREVPRAHPARPGRCQGIGERGSWDTGGTHTVPAGGGHIMGGPGVSRAGGRVVQSGTSPHSEFRH